MAPFDRRRIGKLLTPVIEVAYPPRCPECGLRGCWVCADCLAATPLFAEPRCPICSLPLTHDTCACDELPNRIDRLWVAGPYDGWLRRAIYQFKFSGETARGPHLASMLVPGCAGLDDDVVIVPVPLHRTRQRSRGYDQVAIIASELSELAGRPLTSCLVKTRETQAQVGLGAAERSLNLWDAFAVEPGIGAPPKVLLVDDVLTTGATMTECARALRREGTSWVGAVAIAHGL
ncbi:MAG: ComF family protein [Thermomicrobiales bacterium]|nr:ComF family protein [Thermomicrobiales bacterium]MCO5222921.1 ComF family protein [Thermomicrobiales bacterium]